MQAFASYYFFYQSPCVETAKKIGFACLRLLQYNGIDWPPILRIYVMSKRDHRENNSTHRLLARLIHPNIKLYISILRITTPLNARANAAHQYPLTISQFDFNKPSIEIWITNEDETYLKQWENSIKVLFRPCQAWWHLERNSIFRVPPRTFHFARLQAIPNNPTELNCIHMWHPSQKQRSVEVYSDVWLFWRPA